MHPKSRPKNLLLEVYFSMAKYSFELKLQIVKVYLEGKGGYNGIAKMFGIPHQSIVRRWVNAYKTLGEDGLKRKNNKSYYSVEFKINVLNYMLRTKKSVQETANHYGLNNSVENKMGKMWYNVFI